MTEKRWHVSLVPDFEALEVIFFHHGKKKFKFQGTSIIYQLSAPTKKVWAGQVLRRNRYYF